MVDDVIKLRRSVTASDTGVSAEWFQCSVLAANKIAKSEQMTS